MTDVSRHDAWIRVAGWEDGRDIQTGCRYSSLGQASDFHAGVQQRFLCSERRGDGNRRRRITVYAYDWHVSRQRTEREGPDKSGRWWTGYLAEGSADTLAHAKSAATRELRRLRAEHIAVGGDVGYGEAPTGEQIREYLTGKKRKAVNRLT